MPKTPSKKILARLARAFVARAETHDPVTGAQARGPVWRGPLPRRHEISAGYSPADAAANLVIDERDLGFGVVPGSGLADMLARLQRRDRRLLLAVVQRKAGTRRLREERRLTSRLSAAGITT